MARPIDDDGERDAERAEQRQRPLGAIELQHRPQNAKAVVPGRELRRRSGRPRIIRRRYFAHRQFELQRMHRQFGLDLKAAGEDRKRFDEAPREHPIAGQDIGEGAAENVGDKAGQHPVAGAVAGAIGRLVAIDAGRHHHVEPVADQFCDHRRRARRVIGGVAVDQHVDVGLDVVEHPPHHMALALMGLAADHGAGLLRGLDRAVGGIVVVDIDRSRRAARRGNRRPPWRSRAPRCSTAPEPPPRTGSRSCVPSSA